MVDPKLKQLLRKRLKPNNRPGKLSVEQIAAILERLAYGAPVPDLAVEHGVSEETIRYHMKKACE